MALPSCCYPKRELFDDCDWLRERSLFFPLSRNYTLRREMFLEQMFLGVCVPSKRRVIAILSDNSALLEATMPFCGATSKCSRISDFRLCTRLLTKAFGSNAQRQRLVRPTKPATQSSFQCGDCRFGNVAQRQQVVLISYANN